MTVDAAVPPGLGYTQIMPFKRSRGYEALEPLEAEKDDEGAPEVPTSFATKGVGWSGREKDGPEVIEPDEKK